VTFKLPFPEENYVTENMSQHNGIFLMVYEKNVGTDFIFLAFDRAAIFHWQDEAECSLTTACTAHSPVTRKMRHHHYVRHHSFPKMFSLKVKTMPTRYQGQQLSVPAFTFVCGLCYLGGVIFRLSSISATKSDNEQVSPEWGQRWTQTAGHGW